MREIVDYLNLRYDLYLSNCRLDYLEPDSKYLEEEHLINQDLLRKTEELKAVLSEPNEEADTIRTGFIFVGNGFIDSFNKIAGWSGRYPDLSQGMIIPGYLLGMLLEDLRTSLRTEGDYNPVSYLYMSAVEWDSDQLRSIIQDFVTDLRRTSFRTKIEAVEYFDGISNTIHELAEKLRDDGVI